MNTSQGKSNYKLTNPSMIHYVHCSTISVTRRLYDNRCLSIRNDCFYINRATRVSGTRFEPKARLEPNERSIEDIVSAVIGGVYGFYRRQQENGYLTDQRTSLKINQQDI